MAHGHDHPGGHFVGHKGDAVDCARPDLGPIVIDDKEKIMETNEELQKKARGGQMAIKGTITPDVTTEPVAPAEPVNTPLEVGDSSDDPRAAETGDE